MKYFYKRIELWRVAVVIERNVFNDTISIKLSYASRKQRELIKSFERTMKGLINEKLT